MEYKSVRPSQALLDPENPRLPDGTSNDREAINRLLVEGYTQMLGLARDLVERGEGNPTELPIVMKSGSKYVVLEGNRRFASLKLLGDPKLADDDAHRTAFERIRRRGAAPSSLYCAVAKDRDDADPWITLRHTGANDGVGVRVWSAEQNARHRRRMRAPIDSGTVRSIAIADELTETYQADTALTDLIKKVRTEKLTNIGRLFSKDVLTRLQFVLKQISDDSPQTLWARHSAEQLHSFFEWAFKVLDENSVDAVKNETVRGNLLNGNADVLPATAESMPNHVRLADRPYSDTSPAQSGDGGSSSDTSDGGQLGSADSGVHAGACGSTPGAAGGRNDDDGGTEDEENSSSGRRRDQRDERFLYSAVRLPNLSGSIQRLLREAKQLPIDDNYAVACVLARVILELAVSDPKALAWSGKKEGHSLNEKIRGCILKLDPVIESQNRARQDLMQAFLETNEIGVIYLHQFMHNPSAKADPQLARRFSSAFTPLLISIDQAVA